MISWWLADAWELSPTFAMAWVAWVIVSITLHELGHGWVAVRCGDDVPIRTGHMTLNPFVHIPFPWAWVMFLAFGFTWGLMPVQPANFRGRHDDAKVAFAGPLVNLSLAVFCIVFDVAWLTYGPSTSGPFRAVHTVAYVGVMINLVGFIFNLIPVPPLDGSRIVGDFFPKYNELFRGQTGAVVGFIAFIVLMRWGGPLVWQIGGVAGQLAVRLGLAASGGEWVSPV